ncbi:ankyrin repeat domain-containing protein [Aquimarina algicola]|uniref:Ankyrin repeat domain-containing protein n=1 Tax=Aquimarina algicola TaxID=2589995 RepID=A0A504J7I1_9FLAO|nr:ankyrin repeat domain-containing protein [Aquimarina algicola]TPN83049.1 ankyrin repeat domain-containing protein [Aquimarina algicola]
MKKLAILVMCMTVGFAMANDPIKEIKNYKVKTTEVVNISPFCISIAKGDYDMVKKLIELGTEVNEPSKGMTPLMYAARYNRTEIIKLLLANGAKVNTKDSKGFNAIKYAQLSNAKDAEELLLDFKS